MTTTWYISSLNVSDTLDNAGLFTGSIETQPSVNGGTLHGSFSSYADAQAMFAFYTTVGGNGNNYPSSQYANDSLDAKKTGLRMAKLLTIF